MDEVSSNSDVNPQKKRINSNPSDEWNRRTFVKKSALLAFASVLGMPLIKGSTLPEGLIPIALRQEGTGFVIDGKHNELQVLNDRPLNAETPAHLLNDAVTPNDLLFVRNNGIPPEDVDPATWTLKITGESVQKEVVLSLAELKSLFTEYSYQLTLECGGNGRAEFHPPAKGNQWSVGAVGCPKFTGVRLKDVLEYVGLKDDAVYIGYYGSDTHISGNPDKAAISRGVPISKALEEESLIAWGMNGEDLPLQNGYPLRLVFGGWPASTSGKWLSQIVVRNQVHDGAKMEAPSYRVPCKPVAPGTKVADEEMCIIESMPVKSLITYPKSGGMLPKGKKLRVAGHAWAGDLSVQKMEVSVDFGATWIPCDLKQPVNRLAWQQWSAELSFKEEGYYEVWARATDEKGKAQPMVLPGWNPKGYLNNACHRIALKVIA